MVQSASVVYVTALLQVLVKESHVLPAAVQDASVSTVVVTHSSYTASHVNPALVQSDSVVKHELVLVSHLNPALVQSVSVVYVTAGVQVLVTESHVLPAAVQDASVSTVVDYVQV